MLYPIIVAQIRCAQLQQIYIQEGYLQPRLPS